jgi:hypothetical protein
MSSSRRPFCSDVSRENGESLGATASTIDHWLLVEYRGLWGPNALRASGLSDQVKESLREQVQARPRSRLLFVRRPDRRGRDEFRAYAATSREGEETLRCVSFSSYEDLRELDLATAGEPLERPLFLVCTHGKHDPCCARYGRPLFEALAEQVEDEVVWQTTHIGGDRFAGNLLCLSRGVYYGRVERGDAGRVLDAHLGDRIDLEHYRGRSCYSFAAQAVERDIRERTGLLGLDDLRLVSERGSMIAFADRDGNVHEREVSLELGPHDYLTCTSLETHRPRRYVVVSG